MAEIDSKLPRRLRSRVFRVVRVVLVMIVLAAAANGIVDYGQQDQVCTRCAASSTVRTLYIFNVGGEWGRKIERGRLAMFIEKAEKRPCEHRWARSWRESGNYLYRHFEFGGSSLASLYTVLNNTRFDLEAAYARDPAFLKRLEAAIRKPHDPANNDLINGLFADFRKDVLEHSRTR